MQVGTPGVQVSTNWDRRHTAQLPIDKKGIPFKPPRQLVRNNWQLLAATFLGPFLESSPAKPEPGLNEDYPSNEEQKRLFDVEVGHDDAISKLPAEKVVTSARGMEPALYHQCTELTLRELATPYANAKRECNAGTVSASETPKRGQSHMQNKKSMAVPQEDIHAPVFGLFLEEIGLLKCIEILNVLTPSSIGHGMPDCLDPATIPV
jgi:hypothetical protein